MRHNAGATRSSRLWVALCSKTTRCHQTQRIGLDCNCVIASTDRPHWNSDERRDCAQRAQTSAKASNLNRNWSGIRILNSWLIRRIYVVKIGRRLMINANKSKIPHSRMVREVDHCPKLPIGSIPLNLTERTIASTLCVSGWCSSTLVAFLVALSISLWKKIKSARFAWRSVVRLFWLCFAVFVVVIVAIT